MKNALIGLFSFMILLLAGFAINTSEGRTLRENELSSTVSSSMEKSMEILKLKKDYSITEQKEFAADFIQNAMVKMNSKSKYDVEIMTIDVEKGLLDAKVTETYKQFARPGKVSVRKTIILEDYQNVNNEYFIVTFQDKDGKIVKQMNVYGGSNMDVALLPHEWKNMKFTCLESGIEYTIDTLSGLIVTSNLTFKLGEDSERPHFTVIYNENGGSGKMDPSTFFIGENAKLKKNVYTRNGHTFIGWNTQPNGLGTAYKDEAEIQNMTSINGSEIVLYAQWESKEEYYYVDYNANGGSGTMKSSKHLVGKGGSLDINRFTYNGYVFKEWNTHKDGTGLTFKDGAYVNFGLTKDKRITLYAQWEKEPEYGIYFVEKPKVSVVNEKYSAEATIKVSHPRDYIKSYKIWIDNKAENNIPTTWDDAVADFSGQKQEIRLFKNNIEQKEYAQYVHFAGKAEHGETVAGVVNIPAKEIPKPYTVTYKANGGVESDNVQEVERGKNWYVQGTIFTKKGYTLKSWNTDPSGNGKTYELNSSQTPINGNLTLYAVWEENTPTSYTVTYKANGGVGNDYVQEVDANSGWYVKDAIFKQPGYTLKSWNTAPNGSGEQYELNSYYNSLEKNIILYAQWEATEYTITYKSNGGYGEDNIQTVSAGNGYYLRGEIFTRNGYVLKSWNTEKNGNGARYELDAWQSSLNNDLILYAQWEQVQPTSYTVTYYANDGGAGISKSDEITAGLSWYTKDADTFTRQGYKLVSWNTRADGLGKSYGLHVYQDPIQSDIKLYAQWEENISSSYTITYKANGGVGEEQQQTVLKGSGFYYRGVIFTKTNHTLTSWNTDPYGNGQRYELNAFQASLDKNITLYAQWKENSSTTYTVTYKPNQGDGSDYFQSLRKDEYFMPKAGLFTRSGYKLVCWNTKPNGSGDQYDFNTLYPELTGDLVLYAQWRPNSEVEHIIVYDSNDEFNETQTQIVKPGEGWYVRGGIFFKDGYTLVCWTTRPDGGGTRYELDEWKPSLNEDLRLYAHWVNNNPW